MSAIAVLSSIRERAPVGAPLYAYRVTDDELEVFRAELRRIAARGARMHGSLAGMFCLYAAEEFCRSYRGGAWAWKLVTEPIGWNVAVTTIHDAVERGLVYWQRPIVRLETQQRLLGTLVCEGGLPLHVLAEDRERHLKQFFRTLIRRSERFMVSAERFVGGLLSYLPNGFQNPTVGELSARLADAIIELRQRLPTGLQDDPIAYLERTHPAWGTAVPLRVSGPAITELLRGLLVQPREHLHRGRTPVELVTVLQRTPPVRIERHAVVRSETSVAALAQVLGLPFEELAKHTRILLSLVTATGERHPVAVARLLHEQDIFRLEQLPLSPIRHERAVDKQVLISATVGTHELACAEIPGGQPLLDDTPWVFEGGEQTSVALLSQGGHHTAAAEVRIAVPTSVRLTTDGDPPTATGLRVLDRELWAVRGVARCSSADEEWTVATQTEEEEEQPQFVFVGELQRAGFAGSEFWNGFPNLVRVDADGRRTEVKLAGVQVRSAGTREWRNVGYPIGDLDVRVRDGAQTVFRARLKTLPRGAVIKLVPAEGAIVLQMEHLIGARLGNGPLVSAKAGLCRLQLGNGETNSVVPVDLVFKNGRTTVMIPTPARRAEFVGRDGPTNGPIVFDRFGQVRAVAVSPNSRDVFCLEARILGKSRWLELAELPRTGDSVWELSLESIGDQIFDFFAISDDLDAELELGLRRRGTDRALGTLKVRRYETKPVPTWEPDQLQIALEDDAEARLGKVGIDLLEIRARPLAQPDQPAIALRRDGDHWNLDLAALAGAPTWLVTGHIRERVRLRPLLITPRTSQPLAATEQTGLDRWLQEPNRKLREEGFDGLLRDIAKDWSRPEWDRLSAFVATLGTLPATTFDAVDALARVPLAAASSLVRFGSGLDALRRTWRGMEELPFLWEAVRISEWHATAEALRTWICSVIDEPSARRTMTESLTNLLVEAAPSLSSFLLVVHELFWRTIPGVRDPQHAWLGSDINALVARLKSEARAMLGRHTDDWWPTDLEAVPDDWTTTVFSTFGAAHTQRVLRVPFWLGAMAGSDATINANANMLLSIRRVKTFDPTWFEIAHAIGFAMAGGQWIAENNR